MVLRMTRPTKRQGSSFLTYRKRVPADVMKMASGRAVTIEFPAEAGDEAHTASAKISREVKFSLRTRDPAVAKSRSGIANTYLERIWKAVRSGPRQLTHKQIVALAGKLYRDFADSLEDDPGNAVAWDAVMVWNEVALKGGFANPMSIHTNEQAKVDASLEHRFGKLADTVLQREGLVIDSASRSALLREGAKALSKAAHKLKRNADGDYSPDPAASHFPTWDDAQQPTGSVSVSLASLFDGWKKEAEKRNLAASTFKDYESRLRLFKKWLKHDDAAQVSVADAVRYKDHRLEHASVKTVKDSDLVTLKTVFQWGVDNGKLSVNPFAAIRIKAAKKVSERDKHFSLEEIKAILSVARSYQRTTDREFEKTAAAKRWLPWLCAYSGARIGEVAQLRREDFYKAEGHWFYRITPEAGPVKTKTMRSVPLHEHLIAEGLVAFFEGAGKGYLFLNAKDKDDATKKQEACKNRVQEFIRTVVSDTRVRPNHGWRNTFKSRAQEVGINDSVVDVIAGHSPKTVGDTYRAGTEKALLGAMKKFPRYEL